MVKAFMISFQFQGRTYLALISDIKPNSQPAYSAKLYHETLLRIIPEGQVSFSEKEIGMLPKFKHPQAKSLLHAINESVTQHLQCRQQRPFSN